MLSRGSPGNFNPLPPHGGRLITLAEQYGLYYISIHSLRMEGDLTTAGVLTWQQKFQSTPSAWRETNNWCTPKKFFDISIHSLRMEGDDTRYAHYGERGISIHSLRMEGDEIDNDLKMVDDNFNPLPPHGGRQKSDSVDCQKKHISIHSLRMEGD